MCYLAYPFPWPLCAIVHPFLSGWWRFGGERVCVCYQLRGMREGGFHYASGSPFGIKFRIRGKQSKGSQQHYKPGSAKWKVNNLHLHHHRHRYGTDRQGCVLFQGAEQDKARNCGYVQVHKHTHAHTQEHTRKNKTRQEE